MRQVRGSRAFVSSANRKAALDIAVPGGGPAAPLEGGWLTDCTGPAHDPAADPLLGSLIAEGRARLDPLGLGLDVDSEGRALGRDGAPDARLYVLGPPARAAFWETTAVPDIRRWIETLTRNLTTALTGGET